MACFACMPDCDKCIPKFVACPDCGKRCPLADERCAACGHIFSVNEKQKARALWIKGLMQRNKPRQS